MAASINNIQASSQGPISTNHSVSVPSAYASGNTGLIAIIFLSTTGGVHPGTITTPATWSLYESITMAGSGANNFLVHFYIKPVLSGSESSVLILSQNAVTSSSIYMDIAEVKSQTSTMSSINSSTTSTSTTDSIFAAKTLTTRASESLLVDLVVVAGGTAGLSQSTSGWASASSSSTMWGAASKLTAPAGSFSGPTWSWSDGSRRYAGLRIALPTLTANLRPVASIGSGYSVYAIPGQTLSLSSTSSDPDGTIASYQWQNISNYDTGLLTINNATAQTCSVSIPNEINRAYTIGLIVTDNLGMQSDEACIAIVIQDSTQAVQDRSNSTWSQRKRLMRKNGVWQ